MLDKLMAKVEEHSIFILQFPFVLLFCTFIVIPVLTAIGLSFTDFNSIQTPEFIGIRNYVNLLTQDTVFWSYSLPNTIQFALFVGIGGFILSFFTAWALAQITRIPRTILAIILYSPSMTGGVMISSVWLAFFSGDKSGYLNSILLNLDIIQKPVVWLSSDKHLLTIMIIVSLWNSMGIGFLAMLAGILNIDKSLYEAAYIDGVRNRFQEIIYVTIPAARPQMLFGAVMAVVGTFQNGSIGVQLSGANPTPGYAGQLLVTHVEEYGFVKYEMGYAAAVSVILLLVIWGVSKFAKKLFAEKN